MRTMLRIFKPEELTCENATNGITRLTPEEFTLQTPDLHLALVKSGTLLARCSLWWRSAPLLAGKKVAYIGHYAAGAATDAAALLDEACRNLADHGAALAIGPMDGNTWRRFTWNIQDWWLKK